jgi:hypothetical protein
MSTPSTTLPTPAPGVKPRRRRWLRSVAWLLFALVVCSAFIIVSVLGSVFPAPLEITINGTSVASGLDLAALPTADKLALAIVAAVSVLVALLLGVAALLVVAVALVPVLLLTVGLPVLVGGVVLLALLSPFLLLAWALWRAVKPAPPATMTP